MAGCFARVLYNFYNIVKKLFFLPQWSHNSENGAKNDTQSDHVACKMASKGPFYMQRCTFYLFKRPKVARSTFWGSLKEVKSAASHIKWVPGATKMPPKVDVRKRAPKRSRRALRDRPVLDPFSIQKSMQKSVPKKTWNFMKINQKQGYILCQNS